MIVMKFGGSSTADAAAIRQIASIVGRVQHRKPVVVVSAMGNTTDRLVGILQHTALGQIDESCRLQRDLRDDHLRIASELLTGVDSDGALADAQRIFRDLHLRMLEAVETQLALSGELRDWVLSLGEQLSSLIVAAAFQSLGLHASHMDARKLVITDDHFGQARPRLWETYAKLRWAIPVRRPSDVIVLGGFIGATENGRTTTLGRGGSDLTASIVGAALNAEEVQVWKDVDGMLTCDPRLQPDALCVKHLTFAEAAHLAQSGAKILHPDTVAPARRLRIPIYLRNTFCPEGEGTRIDGESSSWPGVVKSICCQQGLHILRIRPADAAVDRRTLSSEIEASLGKQRVKATLVGETESDLVLAIKSDLDFSQLVFGFEGCLQVHLQSNQALITLVGERIGNRATIDSKIKRALSGARGAVMVPSDRSGSLVRITVPQKDAALVLARLHFSFFTDANPQIFTSPREMAVSGSLDPVKALQDVASAVPQSNRSSVWTGHRIFALAERS